MVGRSLPFRKRRQVGPFTFIDHMGLAALGKAKEDWKNKEFPMAPDDASYISIPEQFL